MEDELRRNVLRKLMNEGKPTLGTHVHSPWPSMIEMVGQSGMFDYVEYVSEYAPYDLHTFDNLGRAIDLFDDLTAMIKVEQEPRGHIANRAMGGGIQNLLFADVRTVEDVEECVRSVRAETPEAGGQHGVNMRRYVRFGQDAGSEEFLKALDDAVIAIMIEKKSAVENLDALLSVKGVDMVQFGPADYSMSIGKPRAYDDPDVMEAEKQIIEMALKMRIHPRAEINTADDAKKYLDMGVKDFCLGTDVVVWMQWLRRNGDEMRKALEGH
ncbi:TPA: 2,4-dihydroxyhept-2-ene-1,7-dioic acid aldolase [Candidatus Latescibacteria bacterium]|nr:2,4-dihydroxyhept-2-ene-1,7-dioic acid aldolase [Candidatus Latescibacterota bacterium]